MVGQRTAGLRLTACPLPWNSVLCACPSADFEKEEAKKKFPEFIRQPANRVANSPDPALQGFVFEGVEGTQTVFWECEKGGESREHVHDFWEYCVVVEGIFDGLIEGDPVHCEAGDECVIPPGAKHSGHYSPGYRAIDAFGGKRVERIILDKGRN